MKKLFYWSQKLEVRSQETGDRSQETEVESQETEVRSLKTEVGSQEMEVRSLKTEVGSQEMEVRRQETEVGSQETEVGSQETEVGSQEMEVGSQEMEDRRQKSGDRRQEIGVRSLKTEDRRQKIGDRSLKTEDRRQEIGDRSLKTEDRRQKSGVISYFQLQASNFQLQTSNFVLQTSSSKLQTSSFKLPSSNFKLQTSNFQLLTSGFKLIAFTCLLMFSISAQSQSIELYLTEAAENNPELKAYFNDYLAALEKVPQVGALPDPTLSFGIFIRPMETLMGNQRLDIQLMQMFPWFGMLKTQKSEAASMASAKYELFRNAKNNLFFQVKNTSYQLYELQQEERIVRENLEILRTYERLALIRFESGTGSGSSSGGASKSMNSAQINTSSTSSMGGGMNTPAGSAQAPKQSMSPAASMGASKSGMSDVLRIRMEIRDLENELALLQSSKVPLQAEFNQLLNRDYLTPIEITEKLNEVVLSLNSIALLDSISENNPMLKMLDAEVDAYQSQKEMARLTARPMIGVGINYIPFSPRMENGMQMGGGDMMMPMLTLSLPIYGKKYQAMAKEADLLQQSVRLRKESLTNQLTTQWSIVIRDLEDANRRTALYKEQTALARQTLNVLIASYSANGSEFEEVLRVQQQLLTYELKHITAIINQHTAVAQLELLTAKALD